MWQKAEEIICDDKDREYLRKIRKDYKNLVRNIWNPFDKTHEGILGCTTVNRLYITPIGDVLMTYDFDNETFIYYSERRTIPIRYLDTVCKKFVIDHNCKIFYKEDECVVEEDNTVSEPEPEEKSESLVSDSSEPFYMKFWNSYIFSSNYSKSNLILR